MLFKTKYDKIFLFAWSLPKTKKRQLTTNKKKQKWELLILASYISKLDSFLFSYFYSNIWYSIHLICIRFIFCNLFDFYEIRLFLKTHDQ